MIPTSYIIWSLRMQGWLNQTGTAGTDRSKAKLFTWDEAIQRCRTMRDHNGAAVAFPVNVDDLTEIEAAE